MVWFFLVCSLTTHPHAQLHVELPRFPRVQGCAVLSSVSSGCLSTWVHLRNGKNTFGFIREKALLASLIPSLSHSHLCAETCWTDTRWKIYFIDVSNGLCQSLSETETNLAYIYMCNQKFKRKYKLLWTTGDRNRGQSSYVVVLLSFFIPCKGGVVSGWEQGWVVAKNLTTRTNRKCVTIGPLIFHIPFHSIPISTQCSVNPSQCTNWSSSSSQARSLLTLAWATLAAPRVMKHLRMTCSLDPLREATPIRMSQVRNNTYGPSDVWCSLDRTSQFMQAVKLCS